MPPKIYDAGESRVCGITTALFPNKFIQVEKYVCNTYENAFSTQNTYHTLKSIRNLREGRFEVQKYIQKPGRPSNAIKILSHLFALVDRQPYLKKASGSGKNARL